MRTSSSLMWPVRPQRAVAALVASVLLILGAGCSDDEPEAGEPSRSIIEPDDETTTTTPTTTTTTPTTTTTTTTTTTEASSDLLTDDQVEAELRRMFDAYTEAFVAAKQRGALDEQLHGELTRIMSPELRDIELAGLEGIGGIDAVVAVPGAIVFDDLDVEVNVEACSSGSATIDLRSIVGDNVPGPRKMFFKIEPSDASVGAWRLTALGYTEDGQAFFGASCEDG